jgi:hypothetical protein
MEGSDDHRGWELRTLERRSILPLYVTFTHNKHRTGRTAAAEAYANQQKCSKSFQVNVAECYFIETNCLEGGCLL